MYFEKNIIIKERAYGKVFWTKFQRKMGNNRQPARGDGT